MREELIDSIAIENGYYFPDEDYFDYEEAYNRIPIRFPSYWIHLESCAGLDALADKIMKEHGALPLFDDSGDYDDEGFYDFSIGINGFNKYHVDTSIYCDVIAGSDNENAPMEIYIDLDDDEQEYIYKELCEQIDVEGLLLECQEYLKRDGVETMILPLAS